MKQNLKLNGSEKKLISEIKDFCRNKNITPRIAGGWVRDKLLGLESSDIDIALDTISGYKFAEAFIATSRLPHSTMCKINPNPEKSKHLETATLRIEGMQVDFLQLRSEIYSSTRIPTIEVASPSVDAYRRDITINSLFYNIMTEEIEDYTNGLRDLVDGIIKTPLDPRVTFLDDPLRILRVIRFAIRLNFTIDEKVFDALQPVDIKIALCKKVSNERVGIEIQKIIKHKNGYKGMLLLIQNGLMEPVFKVYKDRHNNLTFDNNNSKKGNKPYADVYDSEASHLIQTSTEFVEGILKCKYPIDRDIFNLYTCLLHYRGIKINNQFINTIIVKNHLLWTKKFAKRIENIEKCCLEFSGMLANDYDIVFAVRKMKEDWLNILWLLYLYTKKDTFIRIIDYIYEKKFEEAIYIVPTLNGDNIYKMLMCRKDQISLYLECSIIYQIIHNCKNGDELIELVKNHYKLASENT